MREMASAITIPAPVDTRRLWDRLLAAYEALSHRELLACSTVLVLTLAIRGLVLPVFPVPDPATHDEFSYLLAGDTYASGRLVNPTHPMWQHFETIHELMQPVYASKYPPLQGLVLAFGEKIFGLPWAGVYLSAGLMCFFVCWTLQGWLTPNAALLGAILFMLRVGIFSYWMNSYWGGAVPAIGGALVLGGLVRVWRRSQPMHLLTVAVGLAILMHSRPFEGAVLGALAFGCLVWLWRGFPSDLRSNDFLKRCLRAAIPATAILLVSLGAVAYVDYRVTGNVLTMPHALYARQYEVAPMFAFLPLRPEPVYRHASIREVFTGWNVWVWRTAREDVLNAALGKISDFYNFFFGLWPLLVPPLIWPYRLKSTEERITVALLIAFVAIANLPLIGIQAHYAAPIAALMYVRFMQTLSRLYDWRPAGHPVGFAAGVFFVTLCGYQFVDTLNFFVRNRPPVSLFTVKRAEVLHQLESQAGKQLVLVRYAEKHNVHEEWVWNRADIDGSGMVWAREMGPQKDAELLDYFHGRHVWLLEADASPPRLTAYSEKEIESQ
jgi:hypothetical protein